MTESDEVEPLGYLMFRAGAVMRPQVLAALRPLGLGMPEFMCLRMLNESPGRTSAELAREHNVSAQAMNQVLNGLQNVALVSRPTVPASGGRCRPGSPPRARRYSNAWSRQSGPPRTRCSAA